jgi:hypothetical protein
MPLTVAASIVRRRLIAISASTSEKKIPRKSARVESWVFAAETIVAMPPPKRPNTNAIAINTRLMKKVYHIRGKKNCFASVKNRFMLKGSDGSRILLPIMPADPLKTYSPRVVTNSK